MAFNLPALPYDANAFDKTLSAETFSFHHGKHLKTYVDNLNKLLEGSPLSSSSLEEIVQKSSAGMFNNSAQIWNHVFYFYNVSPKAEDHSPSAALDKAINEAFGSRQAFLEKFIAQALTVFGSGWTWLVSNSEGKLSMVNTANAETPITQGLVPLLTVDVWEHAYYIDYRNARKTYLESISKVLNWKLASECFESKKPFNVTKLM